MLGCLEHTDSIDYTKLRKGRLTNIKTRTDMAQPMAYTDSAVQLQTVKTVADSEDSCRQSRPLGKNRFLSTIFPFRKHQN